MNDLVDHVAAATEGVEVKHFALTLDKDGKEVRVEIKPTEGVQETAFSDTPAGN